MARDYTINRVVHDYIRLNDIKQEWLSRTTGIENYRLSRIINSKAPLWADDLFLILKATGMPVQLLIDAIQNGEGGESNE